MELPSSWMPFVGSEIDQPYFHELERFLATERARHKVYPPDDEVFSAFQYTLFKKVKVLILGQDPYHGDGQAHGLAFSVATGLRKPPSLINIFKEMHDDIGAAIPKDGSLIKWAKQGVFLLNAVLTVRAHEPNSHRGNGWEKFTDAVFRALNDRDEPVIFVLWGGPARKKKKLIDGPGHVIIEAAHPSPLSAHTGFFGSRPFSMINRALAGWGKTEIDWRLPADAHKP